MKYYITFGNHQQVVSANNPYQACLQVLYRYSSNNSNLLTEEFFDILPQVFWISQKGFDKREGDEVINIMTILKIQLLSNQYQGELIEN